MKKAALGAAVLAGSVALLLGACGGSDGDGNAAASDGNRADGFAAYTACLREQGISMPTGRAGGRPSGLPSGRPSGLPSGTPSPRPSGEPRGGGFGNFRPEGVDDATWEKAQAACQSKMPTGGPEGGPGGWPGGGADGGAFTAYRNCLRENGVADDNMRDLSTADPKVAAALTKCEVLRPTGMPTGGPGR
ncbi:PT domain-containing protein [Rhizomonospora bruguierae]|uniref:PT domain-containing protein n=1 Tax=Rhizomonospora bruguierae TaxID=1581705 RepID=UPI001BCE77F7|nr:PT domain-containing protein [Micromonospora sp. NBRC 107566]